MNASQRLLAAAFLLFAATLPGAAPFQQEDDPVFVDEEKKDFLDKIERFRASGEWKSLFDLHAQAGQARKAHKLVRIPGSATRFIGLVEYLNRRFADLPPEALRYYRGQYDGAAKREFDRARAGNDREGLERIVDTWFYSSRTDDALDLLANLHLEEGRLPSAVHCWSRLLFHYPDSEIPRAVTAARLARAAAAWGHESILDQVRRFTREKGIEGEVIVGSGSVSLQGFLDGLRAEVRRAPAGVPAREPSISERGWITEPRLIAVRSEIRRWSYDLGAETKPDPPQRRGGAAVFQPDFSFLPAYGRVGDLEMVVFTNGSRLVAVDPARATSARPAEGIYFTFPSTGEGAPRPPAPQNPYGGTVAWTRPYIGVTIDGEHAFATMYSEKRPRDPPGPGIMGFPDMLYGTARLVCVNLRTQQVEWDTDYGESGAQVRRLEFWDRNFTFSGPPLVRGDRVYIGIGTSPMTEEEGRVLCLDRRTGTPIWERFLASVAASRNWMMAGSMNFVSRLTVLEEDRGVLVAHTNLGVLAGLDAVTGQVLWLTKYPRAVQQDNRTGERPTFGRPASPLVFYRGQIFALPQDRPELLVADFATGELRPTPTCNTVSSGPREWRSFLRLVGIMENFLVLGGAGQDSCILDLNKLDQVPDAYGLALTNVSGTGRGCIDGETLYLPSISDQKGGLCIFYGVKSWKSFDANLWWSLGEGGNIIRGGNYLIYASPTRLSILTDSEVVKAEYLRRLRQSPPNPSSLLDYGDLMKANDRWSDAADWYLAFLDAAVGDPVWTDKARQVRTELHGIFLKRGAEASGAGKLEDAAGHFRRARDFAWDEGTSTEAGRLLAKACESLAASLEGNPDRSRAWARRAVEEYQDLIRRARKGFVKPEDGPLWVKTWKFASTRIAALVGKYGPDAYETVERAAKRDLAKAGEGSPEALKAVADLYPDSAAAAEAFRRIAEGAAGKSQWMRAASAMRDLRDRAPKRWTPALQVRLNEVLEKSGDAERLTEELRRMEARFPGDARMGEGESGPTVAQYLEKARAAAAALRRRPPAPPMGPLKTLTTWDPAVPAPGPQNLAVGFDLLAPGGLEPPAWAPDLEFFARGSTVELWNVRTKKCLWSAPHPGGWLGLQFTDAGGTRGGVRVTGVLPGSPAERAKIQKDDIILSIDGVETGGETFDLLTEGPPAGTRLALALRRGEASVKADVTSDPWPASHRPGIGGAVFTGDGTLAVAWEDVVAAFDVVDGRVRWVSRPVRDRFLLRAIHAAEGRVLVHEYFGGGRGRSALRALTEEELRNSPAGDDLQTRVLALDDSDGEPAWALGLKSEASVPHPSARFAGDPLDDSACLIVTGFRDNVRAADLIVVAASDGRELRRVPLSSSPG
ncbi:MAG TPA: PQQ-binding-like beta-propeller repeat protein, partial [Planctomycetota bacterium]